MVDNDVESIMRVLLRNMLNQKIWGGKHTPHFRTGLPKHLVGAKVTDKAEKELVRREWVCTGIKTHETHYWLNPAKKLEIERFIMGK